MIRSAKTATNSNNVIVNDALQLGLGVARSGRGYESIAENQVLDDSSPTHHPNSQLSPCTREKSKNDNKNKVAKGYSTHLWIRKRSTTNAAKLRQHIAATGNRSSAVLETAERR